MGEKNFKNKREHADEGREDVERGIEEKIRMLRKKHGKANQRRKYMEESSAPKRRKLDTIEGYKEQRGRSGDMVGSFKTNV